MEGQLTSLIIIYFLLLMALRCVYKKARQMEQADRERERREREREEEQQLIGARVRRQLTVERFEGVRARKKPVRKFCGELATFENQYIVK